MTSIADVVNVARDLLQDTLEPYRHDDTKLVRYVNFALAEAQRVRPDLFIGLDHTLPDIDPSDLSMEFPLHPMYAPHVAIYIAGMVELSDDEFSTDGRAVALLSRFTAGLKGNA